MNKPLIILGLLLAFVNATNAQQGPRQPPGNPHYVPIMTVFTAAQYPITGIEELRRRGAAIHVMRLDSPNTLGQFLNTDVADDPAEAIAQVHRRAKQLEQSGALDLRAQIKSMRLARAWGVKHVPAIVFGMGEGVVYGITDVREAVVIWRENTPVHPGKPARRSQP